jgi:hypothetical protein
MSNIDKYTNFISEQVRRESTVGLRAGVINEAKINTDNGSDTDFP